MQLLINEKSFNNVAVKVIFSELKRKEEEKETRLSCSFLFLNFNTGVAWNQPTS